MYLESTNGWRGGPPGGNPPRGLSTLRSPTIVAKWTTKHLEGYVTVKEKVEHSDDIVWIFVYVVPELDQSKGFPPCLDKKPFSLQIYLGLTC